MGYERKRGKLGELNALLRGKGDGYFSEIIAEPSCFSSIKYIITLDTDTQLPRDTVWQNGWNYGTPPESSALQRKEKKGHGRIQYPATEGIKQPPGGRQFFVCTHAQQ